MSRIRITSIVITVTACAFWALAIAATWARLDPRALVIEVGAATSASVTAAMRWQARHDRDKAVLIRTLADAVAPPPAAAARAVTGPFPRVL